MQTHSRTDRYPNDAEIEEKCSEVSENNICIFENVIIFKALSKKKYLITGKSKIWIFLMLSCRILVKKNDNFEIDI